LCFFDASEVMIIDGLSQDLFEQTEVPVPGIPPLPAANHSPVADSTSIMTVRGIPKVLFEDSDFVKSGISQDFLDHSMPSEGGTACSPSDQYVGSEEATAHSTHCLRKRMSFVSKCIRATKSFFILSSEGNLYSEIACDAHLNGKILSALRKGVQVYKLFWATSTLPHLASCYQ
jgi:hypothetical protein